MPPSERLQRVQDYLKVGIVKLWDSVRFSCDLYQGFPTQGGESALSNIGTVSEAIQRVWSWAHIIQQHVLAGDVLFFDQPSKSDEDNVKQGSDNKPAEGEKETDDDDEQPMDISSESSDDEGGIIIQQSEDIPKQPPTQHNILGLAVGLPLSPSSPAPDPGGQAQARPNYAGSLKPHPSLPPRPSALFGGSSLPPRPPRSFGGSSRS
ncbi:hypothetical protein PG996_000643 [Apiospora saccharicola]|uniref:Uncharacterized protein n=1 Tax=Apiospora saccharicola TaxID=335842 RepID=A0ABR1WFS5_9PEZI